MQQRASEEDLLAARRDLVCSVRLAWLEPCVFRRPLRRRSPASSASEQPSAAGHATPMHAAFRTLNPWPSSRPPWTPLKARLLAASHCPCATDELVARVKQQDALSKAVQSAESRIQQVRPPPAAASMFVPPQLEADVAARNGEIATITSQVRSFFMAAVRCCTRACLAPARPRHHSS